MLKENKTAELNDKETEMISGGDDPNHPKYNESYCYERKYGGLLFSVQILDFNGHRNGKNYYNVECKIFISISTPALKRAILSEDEITRKAVVHPSGQILG